MKNTRLLSKALAAVNSIPGRHRFLTVLAVGAITVGSAAEAFAGTGVSPAQSKVKPASQPTPTATPDRRMASQQAIQSTGLHLPAPGALHYTTDIGTCKRAGGNDGTCGALLNNAVAFYFNWSCAGNCVISGFKLKDANQTAVDPRGVVRLGGTDPLADAIDTAAGTLFIERPPQGGWGGRCYVVTGYRLPARKLVSDGSGGLHPEGPAIGSFEESPPSPKVCMASLTREVELPALKKRSYTRTYSLTAKTAPATTDDPPRETSWIYIGKTTFGQQGFSVANQFHRAAASFDGSSLGDVTVYRGRFAYDATKDCRPRFYSPAPSGWETAAWT